MVAPCGEITYVPARIDVEAGKTFTVPYEIHNCNTVFGYYKVIIKDHTGAEVYTKEWIDLDPCQTYSDSPSFTAPSTAGDYTWEIECYSWDEDALRWVFQDSETFIVHVYVPTPIVANGILQYLEEVTVKPPTRITAVGQLTYLEEAVVKPVYEILAEGTLTYLEEVIIPKRIRVETTLSYFEEVEIRPPTEVPVDSKLSYLEEIILYSPTLLQKYIERYEGALYELRDVKRFDVVEPWHWNPHKKLLELQDKINDLIEVGLE